MHPPQNADASSLPLVFAGGFCLCLCLLGLAQMLCVSLVGRIRGKSSRGVRIDSFIVGIFVVAMLCRTAQVRTAGQYPGWRLRLFGLHGGAYVDRTGLNFWTIVGGGDPRNGLASSWVSSGRAVFYAGRELGEGRTR